MQHAKVPMKPVLTSNPFHSLDSGDDEDFYVPSSKKSKSDSQKVHGQEDTASVTFDSVAGKNSVVTLWPLCRFSSMDTCRFCHVSLFLSLCRCGKSPTRELPRKHVVLWRGER